RAAGGIVNLAPQVMVLNSTIANNRCSAVGNGSQIYSGDPIKPGTCKATFQLRNTMVSGDGTSPNFVAGQGGTVRSLQHDLSTDNGSGFLTGPGDLINANPLLGQ